jgi:UDP-N-acetylmuramoyl-L-alanyl-D-glutamate--2,6-diaminopimelate ligase
MRSFIKQFIPDSLLRRLRPTYHSLLARLADWYFSHPSRDLIVIGVTGTKGKTTAVNLIAAILEAAGHPTGIASTATIKTGSDTKLNAYKMSTVSEWLLEKWLREMTDNKLQYAVLEMTSEGLAQNRHAGIFFDVAVFTNLTPEHMDAHGSMENYRNAKALLFKSLSRHPLTSQKRAINPQLTKTIVANLDDPYGLYYLNFPADQHMTYGIEKNDANIVATNISSAETGSAFSVGGVTYRVALKGKFDVHNALAAIATAKALGCSDGDCQKGLAATDVVPGRMEVIQDQPFKVMVDYAHEPKSMEELYHTVRSWTHGRIIHVLGPTGGGRDLEHKATLGAQVAHNADTVIVTTDDPYDDDPAILAKIMAGGAEREGKVLDENLFIELDRRAAIKKAVALAQPSDLILITGKGSEQKMVLAGGRMIDWDDRQIAREALA